MPEKRLRVGVLISGGGTNLQAIIDASRSGELDADVAVVIANHEGAYGLERARKAHIPAVWLDRAAYDTFSSYNHAIRLELEANEVDLVVMAGYMRLLGTEVLNAFPNRVLNIHPALLPSFPGGSGIRDSWDYGVKIAGVTVHFANEKFDEGPIIAQEAVSIDPHDTIETFEAKIHEAEYRLYPQVIQWMAQGRVVIEGRKTTILPESTGS